MPSGNPHRIQAIEKNSIGSELGIEAGQVLVSVNNRTVADVFDYRYAIQQETIELVLADEQGLETLYEIEKDEDDDLGLE